MSFVSSLPPLRNLVKATLWCGAIWAVGYGSYKVTVAQMEKNVKTWEGDVDPIEQQRFKEQHERFLLGVLGEERYKELRARAEADKAKR